MTSKQRLIAALTGRALDRVPVTLYEFSHLDDSRPRHDPGYAAMARMQRDMGETIAHVEVDFGTGAGDPNVVTEGESDFAATQERRTTYDTPRGPLTAIGRRQGGMLTWWQVKPLLENAEDCRRWLSLPYRPCRPDVSPALARQRELGDEGLVLLGPGDALGLVCGLFHYDQFIMTLLEDEGLILAMLEVVSQRLNEGLRQVCSQTQDMLIRFWGPEYAGAPLLNPHKYFEKLVMNFDAEAIGIVNRSGNFSAIHCHGYLAELLDGIAAMNPTMLEPLEVSPAVTANVSIEQVKSRLGRQICLMGGIQARELECLNPQQIDARVREILRVAAPGGRFGMLPTSAPISYPCPPRLVDNYRAYFEAAHKYGRYGEVE